MIKNKYWKLQSNEKLSSKISYASSPSASPLSIKKTQSFIIQGKQDFEDFELSSFNRNQSKEQSSSPIDSEKSRLKGSQNIKLQQIQKKVKERQQDRKSKGLAIKMKLKMQEQLRVAQKQLEQKEMELKQMESQISMLNNLIRERKKHSQDIVNNEQMLRFKEGQLNNLNTIHSQIVEGAKRQIAKQKLLKAQNQQKLKYVRKKLNQKKALWREKQQKLHLIEQLNNQKQKLEKYLQEQRAVDEEKIQVQAESVREIVEHLVKKNKKAIEEECEWKVKIIRQCGNSIKKVSDLNGQLQAKGITAASYYTFGQLKRVQQLNFRVNKQAQKIFDILNKQINPRVVEIIEHFQQPKELLQLKVQLAKMEQLRTLNEAELKRKQKEIQQLQVKRKKIKESAIDLKKKNQANK